MPRSCRRSGAAAGVLLLVDCWVGKGECSFHFECGDARDGRDARRAAAGGTWRRRRCGLHSGHCLLLISFALQYGRQGVPDTGPCSPWQGAHPAGRPCEGRLPQAGKPCYGAQQRCCPIGQHKAPQGRGWPPYRKSGCWLCNLGLCWASEVIAETSTALMQGSKQAIAQAKMERNLPAVSSLAMGKKEKTRLVPFPRSSALIEADFEPAPAPCFAAFTAPHSCLLSLPLPQTSPARTHKRARKHDLRRISPAQPGLGGTGSGGSALRTQCSACPAASSLHCAPQP